MIPIFWRTVLAARRISYPAIRALPGVGLSVVVRIEMGVVFPAPFGPSKVKNSPALTEKDIPSTALSFAPLYRLVKFSTSIIGCALKVVSAIDYLPLCCEVKQAEVYRMSPTGQPHLRLARFL